MKGAVHCVCALEVKPSEFLFRIIRGAFTNKTCFSGLDSHTGRRRITGGFLLPDSLVDVTNVSQYEGHSIRSVT